MSQYSDIISDGGMDPRADYEAKRKVQNLESSIKDLIEGGMQYKKERDALMKVLKSLICTAEKDETEGGIVPSPRLLSAASPVGHSHLFRHPHIPTSTTSALMQCCWHCYY